MSNTHQHEGTTAPCFVCGDIVCRQCAPLFDLEVDNSIAAECADCAEALS